MSAHPRSEHLLIESIDFGLSPSDEGHLTDHLAICATCRARSDAFRSDAAGLRQLAFVEPPAGVGLAILERGGSRRSPSIDAWQVRVAAALVMLAIFGAAAAIGAVDRQPRLAVAPSALPSPTARGLPPPSASPIKGLAVQCGPLAADQTRCLQLVATAATGLSVDWQGEALTGVTVQGGSTRAWCAGPQPCISAPPDSYWVEFNSVARFESIPVYGDGGGGWTLGVPLATDQP